jgi:hypothetical protein
MANGNILGARVSEPSCEGTMGTEIDSVIAALKIELEEAEKFDCMYWKAERCNRWIRQLPGAWALQWENLKITGDYADDVNRVFFITHVKASLAYLETKRTRSQTNALRWSWPFTALKRKSDLPTQAEEPIDAEFTDVSTPSKQRKLPKPKIVK